MNVSLIEKIPFSLTLSWEQPSPELRNGNITTYLVSVTELLGLDHVINITTKTTGLTVEGLSPHTTYIVQVAALNSVGMGPFSAHFLAQTAEDGESFINVNWHTQLLSLIWN